MLYIFFDRTAVTKRAFYSQRSGSDAVGSQSSACCFFFVFILVWSRYARADVMGGRATAEFGASATLPCKLTQSLSSESLEQISWQRKTKGKPQTDNFLIIKPSGVQFVNGNDKRFRFIGNFADQNGTLQLNDVNLDDEGSYTCIFSLFPSGNFKTEIPLRVLVSPSISVRDDKPILMDTNVSLVTCTAAFAKPAPSVVWNTGALTQNVLQVSELTEHPNGTFTRVTTLHGRPTKEINGSKVECVVSSEALMENKNLSFQIQVYFPPDEVTIEKRGINIFECLTSANPNATFTWKRDGQPLPKQVSAQGATLHFSSLTADQSGRYQCEATNEHGSKIQFLYVLVPPDCGGNNIGWIFFGLLLAAILIAVVIWYIRKHGIFQRGESEQQNQEPSSPSEQQPMSNMQDAEEST
ncbi:nectin-1 isoform X1 [Kryptolebias marmoratus]|uniref:nectin-1 isoform X1 n=1 Tax=Kryptolebias marmoratus TaxID=37003 RepID=UPI0018ACD4E8|nr:nectin-1 isoform X1 [Kryptolebias marmoratus]XP_037832125.1 nectin-1 isoform X1 [Kryptolebias marmoratus]